MTPDQALKRLRNISASEGSAWLRTLNEFDEPPLFTRLSQVEFLWDLDPEDRGRVAVAWSVEVLDEHAHTVQSIENGASFFLCLIFLDWDDFNECECSIPTPCVLAVPRAADELSTDFKLGPPLTQHGKRLTQWLNTLSRTDLVAGKPIRADAGDFERVYLGYRRPVGFNSVGTFYAEAIDRDA